MPCWEVPCTGDNASLKPDMILIFDNLFTLVQRTRASRRGGLGRVEATVDRQRRVLRVFAWGSGRARARNRPLFL